MEKTEKLRNGLGIASLILGIIGFLTGFIVIGVFFDIIAIILGVIALSSKKNKNGLAIVGIIIASIGLIIMVFILNVFDDSDDQTATNNSEITSTQTNSGEETENEEDSSEPTQVPVESSLTFGSKIELKNFDVVFNSYEIVKIDNQFADIEEAIVISTTITNTSDETQSMMTGITKTCFTPAGTEAGDDSQIYLSDDYPSYWHDDQRAKATLETYLVCDYSGDGEYIIEIGTMFGDPVEVFVDIKK